MDAIAPFSIEEEVEIIQDSSGPTENGTTTSAGTELQGKTNEEWRKEEDNLAVTTKKPECDELFVDVAENKPATLFSEDFGRLTPGNFVAVVKAYVTRTFAEDIELLGKLTKNTGSVDCLYGQLKTSLESGTNDSVELSKARENIFGRNATEQRKPTRKIDVEILKRTPMMEQP